MVPPHDAFDAAKTAALADDMDARGWVGAPLVAFGEQLVTGSHRYAAAQSLDWTDADVPTVSLDDVFEDAGLDFAAIYDDHNAPDFGSFDFGHMIATELPAEVRARYGIQAN